MSFLQGSVRKLQCPSSASITFLLIIRLVLRNILPALFSVWAIVGVAGGSPLPWTGCAVRWNGQEGEFLTLFTRYFSILQLSASKSAMDLYERASAILGYDLFKLCVEGPKSR